MNPTTESFGSLIRADRQAQGLSLQGLADRLNADRSLEGERKVTTSWLHHLENDRAKTLSIAMRRGLARALGQDENKYLSGEETLTHRSTTFSRFFDDQLGQFEQNSTLLCDFRMDRDRLEDLSDLLLCVYHFLVANDGKVVAFENSDQIALPILLTAIRSSPDIDDVDPNEVINKILGASAGGGFIQYEISAPTKETLNWVKDRVTVYEQCAEDQTAALLKTDPLSYLGVVSPSFSRSAPMRKVFYYLNSNEYGLLTGKVGEMTFNRFSCYRDHGLFDRLNYEKGFEGSYRDIAKNYQINFEGE